MNSKTIDYLIEELKKDIKYSFEIGDYVTMHDRLIAYGSLRLYQEQEREEQIRYKEGYE